MALVLSDDTWEPKEEIICPPFNRDACKKFWSSCNVYWRTLLVWGIVLVYLMFGGLIFLLAERPNELATIENAQQTREEARQTIMDLLVSRSNGTINETDAEKIMETIEGLSDQLRVLEVEINPIWGYSSAVFFSSSVITTIGYGNIAPVTSLGQTLFIFYALIGIPISLFFLNMIGKILSGILDLILLHFGKSKSILARMVVMSAVFTSGLILFILIPAAIFHAIETWTYFESIYFGFVSLTTVGFGDFVPALTTGLKQPEAALYRLGSTAWTWIGLAFFALVIAEIQKMLRGVFKACRKWLRNKKFKKDSSPQELPTAVPAPATRPNKGEDIPLLPNGIQ